MNTNDAHRNKSSLPRFYSDEAGERDLIDGIDKYDLPLFINYPWKYEKNKEYYLKRCENNDA